MYSRRSRGRGGARKGGASSGNKVIDSNSPDAKVRGNMHQVWEKYLSLARDATASGDRILAEGYYQHAEHYYRLINVNAGNGSDTGNNKGKEQPQPSKAQDGSGSGNGNSRGRQDSYVASRDENRAEVNIGAEAEVVPKETSAEASPEDLEEMADPTFDSREALAIFPDTSNTAKPEADAAEEAPMDGQDEDAEASDPAAAK